eukprot:scaffold78991_cov48-Attheya_sp.AAC.3
MSITQEGCEQILQRRETEGTNPPYCRGYYLLGQVLVASIINMIYLVIGNARARITDVMLKVRERVKKERGRIFVE